jgi:tetratricopeptide (TPR) repeat protein
MNGISVVLYKKGEYKSALMWCNKALRTDPYNVDAQENKKQVRKSLFKEKPYSQEVDALNEYSQEVDALNEKGVALYNHGKYSEAIEYYDKILKIDPNNESARYNRFLAIQYLSKVKEGYIDSLNNKGLDLSRQGKYQEAIEWYDKALAVDPNYIYALNGKGVALNNLGKNKEAIEYYDKALRIDPNNVYPLTGKGWAFANLGQYHEAIEYYDKALAVDPNFTYAQNNKKIALEHLSKKKPSSQTDTTSKGTMPKGWKPSSSYHDKNTVVDNVKISPTVLTKSDDAIIHQKENLSKLPKEERTVAVGSDLSTSKDTIKKYSFVKSWGSKGTLDGQFDHPYGISVDSEGCVFVADSYNHRIQKFDSDGNFIAKWGSKGTGDGQFDLPFGIFVDSYTNYVYVAEFDNHRIQKFDSNGKFISKWGSYGTLDGQFHYSHGISVDSEAYVYIADMYNNRIQKFDSNGKFISKWGSYGTLDGQFDYPRDITVDSKCYVYVADSLNHRIQKFDSDGNFIAKWGDRGTLDGQFYGPEDIAVDSVSGNVYVADTLNHRIQVFAPST